MMERRPHKPKPLLLRFLMVFIPICVIILLLSWAVYYFQHVKIQEAVIRAREIEIVNMQRDFIEHTVRIVISDLMVISNDQDINVLVRQRLRDSSEHTTAEFISFSKYKGIYDQVRILDKTGMEVIRVDLRGGTPALIPADELQNKGQRYYFRDSYALKQGEAYMSPIDLNIEKGEIERPFKPMIRFGIPLFDQNGTKEGVLILNFLGKRLINDLTRLAARSPGHSMLLNADGYWINGRKRDEEWGFMFEDRLEKKCSNRYPALWREMLINESGQIYSEDGLFTFQRVYLLQEGLKSSSGSPKAFEKSDRQIGHDEYFWVLVSQVLPEDLHAKGQRFVLILLLTDVILISLLGILSWALAVANARRLTAEIALKRMNLNLENTVEQRTSDLSKANTALKVEVEEHRKSIEDKARIESQLRQAQKMEAIGTLAGGIAHDFNNILAVMNGYTEMALHGIPENTKLRSHLEQVLQAGQRATALTRQILMFSRQGEVERKPVDVGRIAKEAMKFLSSTLPSSIEIRQSISMSHSTVLGDPTQIHQVFLNLCTNAGHAMREKGGVLDVSMTEIVLGPEDVTYRQGLKAGPYLNITVSDTGQGMEPVVLKQIFDPFFTTKGQGEGTGMGLAVVHGIVQSHNGAINCYSEPGQGTKFVILFPKHELKEIRESIITPEQHCRGNERLLFVDDEESIVNLNQELLESLGYKVTGITSSTEALQTFRNSPEQFDLVITDMTMPHMTGEDLIREVLRIRPDMPIILCTGFNETITVERAKQIGVRAFVMKPIAIRETTETIRRVLDHEEPEKIS